MNEVSRLEQRQDPLLLRHPRNGRDDQSVAQPNPAQVIRSRPGLAGLLETFDVDPGAWDETSSLRPIRPFRSKKA